MIRFGGGYSSFLSGRKSFTNLFSYTNDNTDVVQNKSRFGAFNFSYDATSKLSVSGFGIFSNVFTNTKKESQINYLQNSSTTFENKVQKGDNSSLLGIGNIKLDYSPNKKEKWYYNAQYQSSTNDLINTINSITNLNSSVFETISKADNNSVKQYLEWHKNYNSNHTTTLVINQAYESITPRNLWLTNEPFFTELIPLQEDKIYTIEQVKKSKNNSIDALFKHYWIINNWNHLYTNIGNNFGTSNFSTTEKQLLTNGTINDFASAGYGNDIKYQLNDSYIGLEYKFRIGKWTNKPGLYLHWYNLIANQQAVNYSLSKTLLQPQWNSEYEFNKSESLNFTYKLVNDFPEANQMANRYTLQNYNLVYKGNALLNNERYHSANLRYSKMNTYQGIIWNGLLNFNKKVITIRNEIQVEGINQFTTPIFSDNPETNYSFNGSVTKKIYRFNLKLNANLNWFDYFQTLNNVSNINHRNNQEFEMSLKTAYKKWPDFSIGYAKGYGQFSGLTQSNYQTDAIKSDFEVSFLKFWTYTLEYENLKNSNDNNQSNFYEIANTSLSYQKKNNPFRFEISVNNLFNIQKKNVYSFSDYMISNQSTYILPRVFMLSVSYKL